MTSPHTPVDVPPLQHVFDLDVQLGAAQELGQVGGGRRRVVPILGGALTAPHMSGTVLAGGADWQTVFAEGITLLQARYTIQMSGGDIVGVLNTGVRRSSPAVSARIVAGEQVDPASYYFRSTPVFEVGPGPYRWLAESVFVCTGERLPDRVRLAVFQVV